MHIKREHPAGEVEVQLLASQQAKEGIRIPLEGTEEDRGVLYR